MIRTGDEYREFIRDGREIYSNGERIEDVVTHPAFKPLVDFRSRIYDLAHDPDTRPVMAYTDVTGEAHAIGSKLPRTQQDWWDKRRATDVVMHDMGGVVTRVGDETIGEVRSLYDGQNLLNEVDPHFSDIAARYPLSGMVGVAVASSSIAIASRCANVRAGVGAALSQNVTDLSLGRLVLDLMESGKSTQNIFDLFFADRPSMAWRRLVLVPSVGAPAVFSGDRTLGVTGESISRDCAAAGNLLANPSVPAAMTQAFEESQGHLAHRLLVALGAGLKAGGEAGPLHAAGVRVADKLSWPVVDLRVDWSDDPPGQLCSLWELYEPQLDGYVQRAQSPAAVPAYGVAGDP